MTTRVGCCVTKRIELFFLSNRIGATIKFGWADPDFLSGPSLSTGIFWGKSWDSVYSGCTHPNVILVADGFRLEGGWNILVRVPVTDSTHRNS